MEKNVGVETAIRVTIETQQETPIIRCVNANLVRRRGTNDTIHI